MTLKLKRTPGLYLVGFMGSGKTTVGLSVARELGWCFTDIDQEIERQQRQTIADIFAQRGENAFRELESAALRQHVTEIQFGHPCVVALGGGAFAQPRNWDIVENNGVTIWLDCPIDTIKSRIAGDNTRPLAKDLAALQQLYEYRKPLYARADFRIDADCRDPAEVTRKILELPIF